MRISQLESLTESELSFLLYLVNVIYPISTPKIPIGPKELLWIKQDALLWEICQQEKNMTDDGKNLVKNLMVKLNKSAIDEAKDYNDVKQLEFFQTFTQLELDLKENEDTKYQKFVQSNFQF